MATYTQILYHIVFGTKNRVSTLDFEHQDSLWRYMSGILRTKKCTVYCTGGYPNHLHILSSLHPSLSLSDTIKDIKLAAGKWIKKGTAFPHFSGWQDGYGAFTCAWSDKERICRYIDNQHEHHRTVTFDEEYEAMLKRAGITYNPEYL
jgi:REP element-mobilizing transposase RayT